MLFVKSYGCNRGCQFCHLTTSGQKSFVPSDYQDFLSQALSVFRHYRSEIGRGAIQAQYMHYSFMARGEALANRHLIENADHILLALADLALKERLTPKFNVSTIMPATVNRELADIFKIVHPTIYYSLYSVNRDFRKKWIPAAMDHDLALGLLHRYQQMTKKIIKIHFAMIDGENDSLDDMKALCDALDSHELLCEFNLVRYNPASPEQGTESPEKVLERNIEFLKTRFRGKVQTIQRIGLDCHASCGMFYKQKDGECNG